MSHPFMTWAEAVENLHQRLLALEFHLGLSPAPSMTVQTSPDAVPETEPVE